MREPGSPSAAKERGEEIHADPTHAVWKAARKRKGRCYCDTCWLSFIRKEPPVAADPRFPSAAPPLKHGDRVTITAAWHPWKGHSGTLIEQPPNSAFQWAVEMDDGYSMRAQVNEEEVTRV